MAVINGSGRQVTGLRIVTVVDQPTGRKATAAPRERTAMSGVVAVGDQAVYNLSYEPAQGQPAQFAHGPFVHEDLVKVLAGMESASAFNRIATCEPRLARAASGPGRSTCGAALA
jgi:hypothetical protein